MTEEKTFQVRATRTGYFGGRKRPGDTFEVTEKQFSERWMEKVEPTGGSQKQAGSSGKQSEQS
jgi:hypothetical protein